MRQQNIGSPSMLVERHRLAEPKDQFSATGSSLRIDGASLRAERV
jgi:hypothetical protein